METTGLDAQNDRIIEIGAVRFENGIETGNYTTFVYPGRKLPEEITRLTGITDNDLKEAPFPAEVLPEFTKFVGTDPLAAHNAPFDIGFLKSEFSRLGFPFLPGKNADEAVFDTSILSRALIPALEGHSLQRIAEHYSIKGGVNHRAEDDARRCGLAFINLLQELLKLGVGETAAAGRILGAGLTGDLFRSLTKYLSENGAPVEPSGFVPYSRNFLFRQKNTVEQTISREYLKKIFELGGVLSEYFQNYEYRPRQMEMAEDCFDALAQTKYLMAEAGTGTGKSFAYLIPAILFSVASKNRTVITTNTKNLQDQLFEKDLPFLSEALPINFMAALLKGRNNYLCRRKWLEILSDPDYNLAEDEKMRALSLLFWANRTTTGDIAENNGFRADKSYGLWGKAASEAGACSAQRCVHYDQCFLQKARLQAQRSHVVVVNHSLTLTDLASANAILGQYKFMVIDEAHNLEKAASSHLGLESSIWHVRSFCHKLYRKDGTHETGLLVKIRKEFCEAQENISNLAEKAIIEVNRLRSTAGEFFASLTEAAKLVTRGENPNYTVKNRYGMKNEVIEAGLYYFADIMESLGLVNNLCREIADILQNVENDIEAEHFDLGMETVGAADEALRVLSDLTTLVKADDSNWVYWWELQNTENAEIRLKSAPLSPGELLNARLYPWLDSIIFTSATLNVGGSFEYYRSRLGLSLVENEVIYKDYGSPFNYSEQAVFGTPVFLPNPKMNSDFTDALAEMVAELAVRYKRGTLVLFTSYAQLMKVYDLIRIPMMKEGINLMAQGLEGSRTDILRRFLKKKSVLLGTDSFWEGIDAPGKALEILIVAKLPFDVPTEPLIQARSEKIEREGGNPFMEYAVPEAAIKLRQGIGRLIRSSSDKGAVVICDSRIINTRWGAVFRDSIPGRVEIFRNLREMNGALEGVLTN